MKMAIPLLNLYKITGNREYLYSVEKLLRWGIKLQQNPGRFIPFQGAEETYTHAHCYASEGMLYSSKLLDKITNPPLLEHVTHAARWLSDAQNNDGSIWNWHYCNKEKTKVCDALSQSIRIWRLTSKFANKSDQENFSLSIKKGLIFLKKMQCLDGDKHSYGGIHYGEKNGEIIPHVNSWVTFFAINASLLVNEEKHDVLIDLLF